MRPNKTFEQLWNEAYITYLKLRHQCNIPLTEEQKELLKKEGVSINGKQNGNSNNGKKGSQ